MRNDYPLYVGRRATVHWCPANESHRLHVICGARRGPGWYVFLLDGCLGRIVGVFESEEAAAQYAARATDAHLQRSETTRGTSANPLEG